jgi:hypothetical protein
MSAKGVANQKARFDDLASANNLTINEKEQFEHYLIAIDNLNAKLLYFNFSSEEEDVKVIDLQKTKTARVDMRKTASMKIRKVSLFL